MRLPSIVRACVCEQNSHFGDFFFTLILVDCCSTCDYIGIISTCICNND